MSNLKGGKRNKWYLILGIIFLVYGTYRLYTHLTAAETDNFGSILAVGFIVFGIYDLFRYFKKV
ncbi:MULTISPECIES: hypothetical protein [Salegentibacter]|uniref:Uncharacterized protein n=1 Tax=Salegentibacter maritimus TaxID=2794347 RepID=A0ABS0TCA9_9FLAO|nr:MULTISPECIES: hypothetical protein [Salegentibacter]MBE7639906.1 hypothetical protein [Salegentibacter sp. BLCTC]MBI6116637.1 hypothetical protein [Salegentibacter maritimus]MBI6118465.1 hypothetical protein [Salegentibacter maritimus]